MKSKTMYIYSIVGLLVIAVIAFSIFSSGEKTADPHANLQNMPQDEIHKGVTPPAGAKETPNKSNVRKEFYARLDSLKTAYEADPNDTLKIRQYADMLASAHGGSQAEELYNKILAKDPKRIDIMLALSMTYYRQGKLDDTRKITERILTVNPDHPEANYNLGAIAAAQGKKDEAKKIWESITKKFPGTDVAKMAESSLQKL